MGFLTVLICFSGPLSISRFGRVNDEHLAKPANQTAKSWRERVSFQVPCLRPGTKPNSFSRPLVEKGGKGAGRSALGLAVVLGTWDSGQVQPASLADTRLLRKDQNLMQVDGSGAP